MGAWCGTGLPLAPCLVPSMLCDRDQWSSCTFRAEAKGYIALWSDLGDLLDNPGSGGGGGGGERSCRCGSLWVCELD